ncbi:M23 family metallopeptidase [Jeotgalibacillus terrae]|uniref:Peptidoglycan DD-metalloendopeptidase family protein n=1 Tax=Jeotgalibacillus terrae TaxID=587735 RepID=A0ABW5ZJ05_9BACL|nr:M23 family metallopeptidase [Jeotgalibacillus terrae]MBM7578824.1 hypothetical protein [Jeotgalibacillus terrae]
MTLFKKPSTVSRLSEKLLVKSILAGLLIICFTASEDDLWSLEQLVDLQRTIHTSFEFASHYDAFGTQLGFVSGIETDDKTVVPVSANFTQEALEGTETAILSVAGEPIFAPRSGIVLFAGQTDGENMIVLQHPDRKKTVYRSVVADQVKTFDLVNAGEQIGYVPGKSYRFMLKPEDTPFNLKAFSREMNDAD